MLMYAEAGDVASVQENVKKQSLGEQACTSRLLQFMPQGQDIKILTRRVYRESVWEL